MPLDMLQKNTQDEVYLHECEKGRGYLRKKKIRDLIFLNHGASATKKNASFAKRSLINLKDEAILDIKTDSYGKLLK